MLESAEEVGRRCEKMLPLCLGEVVVVVVRWFPCSVSGSAPEGDPKRGISGEPEE
jgi:hypothetical protein